MSIYGYSTMNNLEVSKSEYIEEGFIKDMIAKAKSKVESIKQGKSKEDSDTERKLKSDFDLPKVDSFIKPNSKRQSISIEEGLFSKSSGNTIKAGRYTLDIIGTDKSGNLVCTCNQIKIKGSLVTLFGTPGYSIMNEHNIKGLHYVSDIVDCNFSKLVDEIFALFAKDSDCKGLSSKGVNKVNWAQARIADDNGYGVLECQFGVSSNIGKKFACYLKINTHTDKWSIGGWIEK